MCMTSFSFSSGGPKTMDFHLFFFFLFFSLYWAVAVKCWTWKSCATGFWKLKINYLFLLSIHPCMHSSTHPLTKPTYSCAGNRWDPCWELQQPSWCEVTVWGNGAHHRAASILLRIRGGWSTTASSRVHPGHGNCRNTTCVFLDCGKKEEYPENDNAGAEKNMTPAWIPTRNLVPATPSCC